MSEKISEFNLDKAIQRIAWRFSSDKSFKPNENDIDSVNCLIDWVNRQRSETIKNNQLFGKLYIYLLNQGIRHYEATVFDSIPKKELSSILNLPLANFYTAFHKELHSNQIIKLTDKFKEDGLQIELKEFEEKYSLEFVTEQLDTMINECLNRFS